MNLKIYVVDAFTSEPFRGNPAGVCILRQPIDGYLMQALAAEMKHSETAFLLPEGKGYSIRYFTPETEVPLCGHATLASSHILWNENIVPKDKSIKFEAKGGSLEAFYEKDWIRLDFPAIMATEADYPENLEKALGAVPVQVCTTQRGSFLVELDSEESVRNLTPDFELLRKEKFKWVNVTAKSNINDSNNTNPSIEENYDFVSRFFATGVGINEDPVTGVAHCSLGPYWSKKLGKTDLAGYQASKRGGIVKVRVKENRVHLLGQAVTIIRGEISERVLNKE